MTNDKTHSQKLERIQKQIRAYHKAGKQAKMYHGSTNSTRLPDHELARVDVSDLTEIIEINTNEMYVLVEPNVPLDKLVAATIARGVVPPMIAEFPGITVGGAVQGGSGESSSHYYGLFSDTCLEYEVVLGNGEVVTCSREKHADLFSGLACAFGSLGALTLVKIKLIPATTYVEMTYHPVTSVQAMKDKVTERVDDGADFVDGIMYSPEYGIVVEGAYTNKRSSSLARFSRFWNDWFYLHVQRSMRGHTQSLRETTPLTDYLFRYDRGAFWVAKYGFNRVPFNRFTRLLFAGIFKTRTLFKLVHASGYAYVYYAQDICLPQESFVKFGEYNDSDLGVYPLWICPLRTTEDKLAPTHLNTDMVINVGIWGIAQKPSPDDFKTRNRQIEKQVRRLGGRKVLYAHAYYTPSEFWQIYDHHWYSQLRRKYRATTVFPDIFDKTYTRPLGFTPSRRRGLRGLFKNLHR